MEVYVSYSVNSIVYTVHIYVREMKSIDLEQFNVKDEGRHWWDETWETSVTVSHEGRNGESCLLTEGELSETLIPTLNDHTLTNSELEWLISIDGRVELLTVGESTGVVDGEELAWLWVSLTVTWGEDFDLEFCWSCGGHCSKW